MARTIRICSLLAAAALVAAAPALADVPGRGDLAAYLRARAAGADGQGGAALAAYRVALAAAPPSPLVAIRAYREALAGGDLALARRSIAVLDRAGVAPMDAALFPLADAAAGDDPAAATRALVPLRADRLRLLVPALEAWIAFAAARTVPPPAPLSPGTVIDPSSRRLVTETRALLLLAAGRIDEGLLAARAIDRARATGFRIAAAELLIGAGRRADALALIGPDRPALAAAEAGAVPAATLAFGLSRLLLRIADDLAADQASPAALALARAALVADPGYARAHLVLADQLAAADPDRAAAELAAIPPGTLSASVSTRRIALLGHQRRLPEALAIARPLAEAPAATIVDRARYADLLLASDRARDSLPWYRAVVKDPDGARRWAAWLRYGGALDEAGRWNDARRALRRAAALGPDEPGVLNMLGYLLVDRDDDIAEGTRLLERAHALDPEDAAITDSLGWAYHRAGDTARALPLIERAAIALPTDPEVAAHLGDLYWTLGRRYEARYQWRAAALVAGPRARAGLSARIADGLPPRK